ncbi:MAG: mycofactocin radical SAM maturase, partial [Microthrixaceae bacterium]|nr:mycofactocin radical SAM maturase [Microthrixaceae bacterium]
CMASKFFVGLDVTDPDPECVHGAADEKLAALAAAAGAGTPSPLPRPAADHSRPGAGEPVPVVLRR